MIMAAVSAPPPDRPPLVGGAALFVGAAALAWRGEPFFLASVLGPFTDRDRTKPQVVCAIVSVCVCVPMPFPVLPVRGGHAADDDRGGAVVLETLDVLTQPVWREPSAGTHGGGVPRLPTPEEVREEKREEQKKSRPRYHWSDTDDARLLSLVAEHGRQWRRFTTVFHVSDDAIRNRWKRLTGSEDDEDGVRPSSSQQVPRIPWTEREDAVLREAMENHRYYELRESDLPRHPRSSWRNRIHRLGLTFLYSAQHKCERSVKPRLDPAKEDDDTPR